MARQSRLATSNLQLELFFELAPTPQSILISQRKSWGAEGIRSLASFFCVALYVPMCEFRKYEQMAMRATAPRTGLPIRLLKIRRREGYFCLGAGIS